MKTQTPPPTCSQPTLARRRPVTGSSFAFCAGKSGTPPTFSSAIDRIIL
jgi:hypothetical protein